MENTNQIKRMGKLAAIVLGAALAGCSSKQDAINAAVDAGWKEVRVVRSNLFNITCADYEKAYHIEGKNAADKYSKATVCCGHMTLKGCTVRYR